MYVRGGGGWWWGVGAKGGGAGACVYNIVCAAPDRPVFAADLTAPRELSFPPSDYTQSLP